MNNYEKIAGNAMLLIDNFVDRKEQCPLLVAKSKLIKGFNCLACAHYGECRGFSDNDRRRWAIEWLNEQERSIITLCGSTRFKDDFMSINKMLTLQGNVVLMPSVFQGSGDDVTDEQKTMLDCLHKEKIAMADLIYIINKGGYIGESTRSEIEYAILQSKPIVYMEENK